MIERERLDIVSVATRPATHREIVVYAAEHGVKGIYCEKPLCCSMAEADAIVAACEQHGVKFNYGAQRRYMPLYHRLRELIAGGEIGEVRGITAHTAPSSAQWGLTHTSDMLLLLAGDPTIELVQSTVDLGGVEFSGSHLATDPRVTSAYVRFSNGIPGYVVTGAGAEFEVIGTKGAMRTLNNGAQVQLRRADDRHRVLEEAPFPDTPRISGTVKGIEDIVEALDTGRETQGHIRLAHRSQEMILGFVESHRQDGRRIPLPLANRELYVGRPDW
jgi:predicted dehydrogenase